MGCSSSAQRETHRGFNFYAVDCIGEQPTGELDDLLEKADPDIVAACEGEPGCIIDAELTDGTKEEKIAEGLKTLADERADMEPPSQEEIDSNPYPPKVDPKTLEYPETPDSTSNAPPATLSEESEEPQLFDSTSNAPPAALSEELEEAPKEKASSSGDPHFKVSTQLLHSTLLSRSHHYQCIY